MSKGVIAIGVGEDTSLKIVLSRKQHVLLAVNGVITQRFAEVDPNRTGELHPMLRGTFISRRDRGRH